MAKYVQGETWDAMKSDWKWDHVAWRNSKLIVSQNAEKLEALCYQGTKFRGINAVKDINFTANWQRLRKKSGYKSIAYLHRRKERLFSWYKFVKEFHNLCKLCKITQFTGSQMSTWIKNVLEHILFNMCSSNIPFVAA